MSYRAFFKRQRHSIDGWFTIKEIRKTGEVILFERLPARSGQVGHTETNWERGKSPTPTGDHLLSTRGVNLNVRPDTLFFPISSKPGGPVITNPENLDEFRIACGLHFDTPPPGSAGCIAIADMDDWRAIERFLTGLGRGGFAGIPIKVFF